MVICRALSHRVDSAGLLDLEVPRQEASQTSVPVCFTPQWRLARSSACLLKPQNSACQCMPGLITCTLQIVPLTAAEHAELQSVMRQIQMRKQQEHDQHKKLSTQNPTVEWIIWLFKPPSLSSGRTEYVVKRLVTAPFRSVYVLFHQSLQVC